MSVYKRKHIDKKTGKIVESKNWYISYYYEGQKIRDWVSPNKRVAEDALKAVKGEIAKGKYNLRRDTKSPKFEDFAKTYLEYSKANKRSYETDITMFKALSAFFKGYKLTKITLFLIEKCRIERGKKVTRMSKKPIVTIGFLNTAMRLREILYLKWGNVDFNRNMIVVTQTKSSKNRNVPMNDLVIEALQGIKRKSEYVFCDPKTGDPYHSIKTTFSKALKRAGLTGVRFHDMRHTAATMMVMGGVNLATVKEILGHSSIEMTMRYAHPTAEGKMNAVKALEKQMEDLDRLNTGSTAKAVSIPKVVSGYNK